MPKWTPYIPKILNSSNSDITDFSNSNFSSPHPGHAGDDEVESPLPEVIVYIVFNFQYNEFIEYNNYCIKNLTKSYKVYVFSIGSSQRAEKTLEDNEIPNNLEIQRNILFIRKNNPLYSYDKKIFETAFSKIKSTSNVCKFYLCDANSKIDYNNYDCAPEYIKEIFDLANEILQPNDSNIFSYVVPRINFNAPYSLLFAKTIDPSWNASDILCKDIFSFVDMNFFAIHIDKLSIPFKIWYTNNVLTKFFKVADMYTKINNMSSYENIIHKKSIEKFIFCNLSSYDKYFFEKAIQRLPDSIELTDKNYYLKMNQ